VPKVFSPQEYFHFLIGITLKKNRSLSRKTFRHASRQSRSGLALGPHPQLTFDDALGVTWLDVGVGVDFTAFELAGIGYFFGAF
jgi:hypothetical protein